MNHAPADLFEIPGVVRVDRAKPYRRAKATEALLDDSRTASHYREGAFDALGRKIVLGRQMTYVDWLNKADIVWRVYAWRHVTEQNCEKWVPVGEDVDRDAAIKLAVQIATPVSGG